MSREGRRAAGARGVWKTAPHGTATGPGTFVRQRQLRRRPSGGPRRARTLQRRPRPGLRRRRRTPAECSARFRDLFGADVACRADLQRHRCEHRCARNDVGFTARAATMPSSAPTGHTSTPTRRAHPSGSSATKLIDLPCPDAKLVPEQLAELAHLQGVQHHVQPGRRVASPRRPSSAPSTPPTRSPRSATRPTGWACSSTSTAPGSPTPRRHSAATPAALRSFTIDAGVDALSLRRHEERPDGRRGRRLLQSRRPPSGRSSSASRSTQLPSKMRFLAAQFNAILARRPLDRARGPRQRHGRRAVRADRRASTASSCDGPPAVNSVFPSPPGRRDRASSAPGASSGTGTSRRDQVRWMTAWDTTADDVDRFAAG